MDADRYIVSIRVSQKNLTAMKRSFPFCDFFNHPLLVVECMMLFSMKCSYSEIADLERIKLQAKAEGNNTFHFSFFDGEPTLHPDFLTALSKLQMDCGSFHSIEIATDMSQNAKWWCSFIDATERLHHVFVTALWKREYDRRRFGDKVFLLAVHRIRTLINIDVQPEMWDCLFEDAKAFYDRGLDVALRVNQGCPIEQAERARRAFPHHGCP